MHRLPEDIPKREALINAGFINYAVLQNHRSIETIRGINSKDAKEIYEYMAGGTESSTDYTVREVKKKVADMDKDETKTFIEGDERKSVQKLA